MQKIKFNSVQKLVYSMLIECTGRHFLDSGFDNGRHWQKNKKKTILDFFNESEELIIFDYGYFERTVSLFHFLGSSNLDLDNISKKFNRLNSNTKDWDGEIQGKDCIYGVSANAANFLNSLNAKCLRTFNTCNFDSDLSQVIQGSEIEIFIDGQNETYFLIQIHNGADVRGGYTDAKLFYCKDSYISDVWEYKCQNEIKEDIIYGLPVYNNLLEQLKVDVSADDILTIYNNDEISIF
jgi:hypothetical protein